MLRRLLIRLRFMPVIGWLFDHMPAFLRWGWLFETSTSAPVPVYVPPRDVKDDQPQQEEKI